MDEQSVIGPKSGAGAAPVLVAPGEGYFASKALEVKAIDVEKRLVDFVASTDVIDSHGEVVDQGTWMLDDYLKNPVVLFAHNSRDLPIGRAVDVGVRSAGGSMRLECRIEFATAELNPKAEQVFQMIRAKFLRAVSVGFVPKSYRWEMRNSVEVFVWADSVLKEISVTPVPANPEALAKMKAFAPRTAQDEAIRQLYRELHEKRNDQPASISAAAREDGDMTITKEMLDAANSAKDKALADAAVAQAKASETDARAKALEGEVIALAVKVKALETDRAAFDAQTKTLADERDAASSRAEKAEAQVIEHEVEALVGKKIAPAEKPLFVDLRKSNPDLFAKMIEQRAPLQLDQRVVERDAKASAANGVDDLLQKFKNA
jgi:HK97 family phage prohead protease